MRKIVIPIIFVILSFIGVRGEYPYVYDNRTYYSIIYQSEHVKGETYTIIFVNEGEVTLNTHSEHISMGTYYQNATHRFFVYTIIQNIPGGWKTFIWNIYDSDEDLMEIAYVDIHVLLDALDEAGWEQEVEDKDRQIRDLEELVGEAEDRNVTIEFVDRTITEMMSEWVGMDGNQEGILFWIWIGSTPSIVGVYFMFRSRRYGKAFQYSQKGIKMKTSFWELTFDKLVDIISVYAEGVPSSEIEVREIFQNESIVLASMFSNKLIDWLTCIPASIKVKYKHIHFVDMDIRSRIERIRNWDKFGEISVRYDLWAQMIRTALIPACVMFPEFWGEQIEPLIKLYNDYDNEAKKLMSTKKKGEGETEETEFPGLISEATSYMQGGKGDVPR